MNEKNLEIYSKHNADEKFRKETHVSGEKRRNIYNSSEFRKKTLFEKTFSTAIK